jgi:hypothetical protein
VREEWAKDPHALDLLKALLAPDPGKRPNADLACDMEFLWSQDGGDASFVAPNKDPTMYVTLG